jgi:hypothetical protein
MKILSRFLIFILSAFVTIDLSAQSEVGQLFGINHPFSQNQKKQFLELGNDMVFGSNGVDNVFGYKMVFGGHIESSRIEDNYDRLPRTGRTSFNSQFFFRYWDQDTPKVFNKYNVFIEIGTRYYGQSKFDKDHFGLIFRGNAPYAGEIIKGEGVSIRSTRYTNYTIGLHRTVSTDENTVRYGAGLSYIQLLDYTDFEIEKGSFFTEEFGQYLEMDLKYQMYRTDRPVEAFKIRGHGAGLNAFYQKTISSEKYFKFSIQDLGFAAIKDINHYVKDTSNVVYEGYKIVSGSGDDGIINNVLDTLLNIVEDEGELKNKTVLLPGLIRVSVGKKLNKGFVGEVYAQQIISPHYIPDVSARLSRVFNDKYLFGISLGYGGFDRQMKIGFQGSAWFKDAIYLHYNVSGLDGFVIPEITQGFQANFGLALAIK